MLCPSPLIGFATMVLPTPTIAMIQRLKSPVSRSPRASFLESVVGEFLEWVRHSRHMSRRSMISQFGGTPSPDPKMKHLSEAMQ
jgi:hypothetical protein